jgi:uncharacterized membrane protein YqgA involved in biofilm formation
MQAVHGIGVWTSDWVWGLLLITLSLVFHAGGLGLIAAILTRLFGRIVDTRRRPASIIFVFAIVMGITALLLAVLHGIEVMFWAFSYLALGAMPALPESVYFSLAMMSTSGADVAELQPHWKLMGSLEAVGGLLLFGLSTAFLFDVMRRIWPASVRDNGGASAEPGVHRPLADAASREGA